MNDRRNSFAVYYIVMIVSYVGIIAICVFFFSMSSATPARIVLNDCPMYLKKGFTAADAAFQDFSSGPWANLPGGIKKSGLVKPLPFLWPKKQDPEDFTYVLKFAAQEEQLTYLRDNSLTPALYIPLIAENWEIYLNSRRIAKEIHLDEKGSIVLHKNTRLLSVPFDLSYLREGENTLVFHIITPPWYSDAGLPFTNRYYIDDLKSSQSEHSHVIFYIFSGIYFFMGFYDFLMYLGGRKEKYRIFFCLEMLILAFYMFLDTPYRYLIFADSSISLKLELMAVSLTGIPIVAFVHSLCGKKLGIVIKIFLAVYGGIWAFMALAEQQFLLDLLTLAELFILISLVYCYVTLIRALRGISLGYRKTMGKTRALITAIFDSFQGNTFMGFNIVLVSVVIAIIQSLITREDSSIPLIGLFAFSTSISFAIAMDFSKTKRQVENNNAILEETVRERTMELKLQSKKLEEQTIEAVAANQAKSRFLATMSHEIRTPMNAILGLSEMVMRIGGLPETVYTNIGKIRTSGSSLLSIINDILDLSKIESGRLTIEPWEYELPSLINDVVQMNMIRIGSRDITFTLEVGADLPRRARGDELRVKQILNNILSNAFKYTEKGFVRMTVSHKQGEQDMTLVFQIADSGQGMREEDVKKLFDEYSRFNIKENRATEGTGLGMNITHKLVSMMNGTIKVKSEYHRGSVFIISLPQGKIDDGIIGEEAARSLKNFSLSTGQDEWANIARESMPYGSVMVVDDLETNLYVASGLLSPYELSIETVGSGEEALEKIRSGRSSYDIIFMDHMMPGMDGIEATRRIRDLGYTGTIIALTANAISGQAEQFLQNGFDDYISKPIDTRQLDRALHKWVKNKHPGEIPGEINDGIEGGTTNAPVSNPRSGLGRVIPGVDTAQGLALTGGTEALYRKVLAAFRKDAEERLPLLREIPSPETLPFFTTQVHALKSASASIGATGLSVEAAQLEAAGKAGDLSLAEASLPGFAAHLAELVQGIRVFLDEASDAPAKNSPIPAVAPRLHELGEALKVQNAAAIDRILEELDQEPLDSKTQQSLEQISDQVLLADFDSALETLKALDGG